MVWTVDMQQLYARMEALSGGILASRAKQFVYLAYSRHVPDP